MTVLAESFDDEVGKRLEDLNYDEEPVAKSA